MATYSNLGIKLIATGDESGTWGSTTNNNFSDIIDEAVSGVLTYNISSDSNFTLTLTDGVSSDARHAVIKFTSTTLSATRTCTFAPDDLQKVWIVVNATTGGQSLTFKQGSAGSTVTVANGQSAIIYSDGAGSVNGAVSKVLDSFAATAISVGSLTASTPIGVASGGTGQSSFSDGELLIGNSTGNTLSKATLTAGSGISITNGSGTITITASGSYGDVAGPASSTDNAIARFDGTTGKVIQNSLVTVDDSGNVGAVGLTLTNALSVANGGTGSNTLTLNNVLLGNGTSALQMVAPGTSGNVLTSNGTTWTSAPAGGGLPELNVVSGTSQTAVKSNQYVLTNAAATTLTLPSSPTAGDVVWVTVANGRVDNVVARNGQKIQSISEDMILDAAYAAVQLRYVNSTIGWSFT
jgi:hypothetical protein